MRIILILLLTNFVLNAKAQVKTLVYKGEKRKYLIYAPKSYQEDTLKAFPVVFNFHGGGMTMAEQMLYTQMNKTADKHDFIVVYPKGIKEDWNVGFGMPYRLGTGDIGFVDSLLTRVKQEYRVDSKNVFATGLSRGGFFCHRIAAELGDKFTAIASVGATLPDSVAHYHNRKNTIGVMIVHGTDDKIVDYNGKENAYYSAFKTYQYWKKINDLNQTKEQTIVIDKNTQDGTSIKIVECGDDKRIVSLLTVINGGHTWPGKDEFNVGLPIGKTSAEIDLNEYIWSFFERQSK
jgi:polyhydroxybutyrate depolymerase